MITQEEVRKHFSYNKKTGILRRKTATGTAKIGDIVSYKTPNGYLSVSFKNKKYQVHRLIWFGMTGYFPENDIDHINRIRDDNRWKNLREVSKQCNARNCNISKNNNSGITGICWNKSKNKWAVQIMVNRKKYYIGRFKDFDEAVCHRLAVEQCLNWDGCDSNSSAYQYVKENIQS